MDGQTLTFIPASEAAEMVGVSAQTIRNLCKAGTIRYQLRSQLFYICKEDVEQYMQSITEVHEIEQSIATYKDTLKKVKGELERESANLQEKLITLKMFPENATYIMDFLYGSLKYFGEKLEPQEMQILESLLHGGNLSEISNQLSLSRERTRQVLERAIHKTYHFQSDLESKDQIIQKQEQIINELQDQLAKSGCDVTPYKQMSLLETRVENIAFSVRTMNLLYTLEIETIGDLVKCRRDDLLKYRNFGKKSLAEIEAWLEAHGLALAE